MKWLLFTLTVVAISSLIESVSQRENDAIQKYLEKLAKSGYNTHIMPASNRGPGKPIDVVCTMYLLDVYKIDDVNMDYKAEFYFRQAWNDSRLAYPDEDLNTIVLNDAKHIWTPDLFFVEEKEGIHHKVITPNVFIRIGKFGEVLFSVRLTETFSCPMDFRKYPHDTHKCSFSVESYGFKRSHIELSWKNISDPVARNMDIDLLPFRVTNLNESTNHVTVGSGEYSRLEVELTFQRKTGYFFTRLYIPYMFLIALTFLSFLIPAKLVVPRLSLLLVIFYLMVHIGHGVNKLAPKSSYTKGSDVWIAVCQSMVFAAFLEFIMVYVVARNKDKLEKGLAKNDPEARGVLEADAKIDPVSTEPSTNTVQMIASRLKRDVLLSGRIDRFSRILFPVMFIAFNFIYWLVYCTGH